MSTDLFQARQLVKQQRNNGTLINGCGKQKQRTAIVLDNGTVLVSPFSVQRIMTTIEKANSKSAIPYKSPSNNTRLVSFDVRDDDPKDTDQQFEEMSCASEDE